MSPLAIYNTLTRRKETFVPIVPGRAGIYVCGPTVYDYIHIGNARTFAVFDLVVRWLRSSGYAVTYVRNITDVDDKIMDRARERGEPIDALTERTVAAFAEAMRVHRIDHHVRPKLGRDLAQLRGQLHAEPAGEVGGLGPDDRLRAEVPGLLQIGRAHV